MNKNFAMRAVAQALAVLALTACGGGDDNQTAAGDPKGEDEGVMETAALPAKANLVVRARASLAANIGPLMQLRVNGKVVASTEVRATAYQNYSFTVPAIADGSKIDVVFNNDGATSTGEDRNLFVESITANGTTTVSSTANGVTYDRGAGALAFDGQDVLPGTRSMLWNGALRFQVRWILHHA